VSDASDQTEADSAREGRQVDDPGPASDPADESLVRLSREVSEMAERAAAAHRAAGETLEINERAGPARTEQAGAALLRSAERRLGRLAKDASSVAALLERARASFQEAGPQGNAAEPEDRRGISPGARVLAAQIAAEGGSRDAIAARLRDEFGLAGADAIVDERLGADEPRRSS
jgi:hypothetical protein